MCCFFFARLAQAQLFMTMDTLEILHRSAWGGLAIIHPLQIGADFNQLFPCASVYSVLLSQSSTNLKRHSSQLTVNGSKCSEIEVYQSTNQNLRIYSFLSRLLIYLFIVVVIINLFIIYKEKDFIILHSICGINYYYYQLFIIHILILILTIIIINIIIFTAHNRTFQLHALSIANHHTLFSYSLKLSLVNWKEKHTVPLIILLCGLYMDDWWHNGSLYELSLRWYTFLLSQMIIHSYI